MNAACSTCLGSFTSISDISTTQCGHVFHTDCIEKWLENGSNSCSQCRKELRNNQIIKLYFSEGQSENILITELEDAKLEETKGRLKFQNQVAELKKENSGLQGKNSDLLGKNSELQGENLKLTRHVKDIKSDSKIKERTLNKRIEELTNEVDNLKSDGRNHKKRKYNQTDKINAIENLNKDFNSLEIMIENDDRDD